MATDMTMGKPTKAILLFALPMVLGNIFQQVYNLVDSLVVGRFVSQQALAAVGASYPVTYIFIAIATGASAGCSVVISQLFGAKKMKDMKTAMYTALISMSILSIVLMVVGIVINQPLLRLLQTPSDTFQDAATYLHIYFLGTIFLFEYNIMTGIFNAMGDSKTPLLFLVLSSIINIVLDLWFVIGLNWGVAGVAWATLIAQAVSSILSVAYLAQKIKHFSFEEKIPLFDMPTLKQMLRIAVPSTLQQSIISFGTLFLQALINSYGSSVVAGYTAAIKIDGFASTPLMSIGNAMSIYAAQNIGANNPERIKKGYRAAWYMVFTIFVLTVLVSLVFGRQLIGMFIDGTPDDLMMWAGLNYLVWISFCSILRGGMLTTNGVLRGAKDIKVFTASTLSNFFIRVIFSYLLAPYIGVSAVWIALPIGLSTGLLISLIRYFTGGWKKKAFAQFE